ncbi:hypothetical protein DV736_g1702, partial [Chaetothyriales sp. CBS 134916]
MPASQKKQATISSFFTKPPSKKPAVSPATTAPTTPPRDADFDLPQAKRRKVSDESTAQTAPPTPNEEDDEPIPAVKSPTAKGQHFKALPTRSPAANRTSKYIFNPSSSIQGNDEPNEEDNDDSQQREALHRRFVKKLGKPDSIAEIKRRNRLLDADGDGGGDDDDIDGGDSDDEPRPTKGKSGGKKGAKKLTPMEKQIIDIKSKHMDTLLVVEVGYKFRFFGEDARVAAKELNIMCIPGKYRYDEDSSEAHLDRFASASFPTHRLHVHVKRLVTAGYKVGVVRQLETAALKAVGDNRNAPFVRKLTNLYTKGTYIDDSEGLVADAGAPLPQSPSTGLLLCMTEVNVKGAGNDEKVHVGLVGVQTSTAEIIYDDFEDGFMRSDIETRFLHLAPCELLIVGQVSKATDKLVVHLAGSKSNALQNKVRVERVPRPKTAAAESHNHVSNFYADKLKAAAGDERARKILDKILALPEHVTVCLSAMIKHLESYGLERVFDLTKYFQPFSARSHMLINGNTLNSLEIYQNSTDHAVKGSLFWSLDRTITRFGSRLLRKWVGRPLLDTSAIEARLVAVEELLETAKADQVDKLRRVLAKLRTDLEKSLIRIYYGKCTRPELLTVLQALQYLGNEYAYIKDETTTGFDSALIASALSSLPSILSEAVAYLDKINLSAAKSNDKYAFFREQHETDLISEHKHGIASVEHDLDSFRSVAAEKLSRKTRVDYVTVQQNEYLIEVDNSSAAIRRVPASWVKISGTKKVSRFHPPEVSKLLRERDQHKESLAAACDAAYMELLADISTKYQLFRDCIQSLATLDCLLSLASVASRPGYSRPIFSSDPQSTHIDIKGARHPMVEQLLLDSYLGSFVPCERAHLGILDAVFTRMGAFDNMMAGESTFMVELSETADIVKLATQRSLVVLDELGRGTSTHDGMAIAASVLDYLIRHTRCLTLFITHYQALARLTDTFPGGELKNVHMRFTEEEDTGVSEERITFLYEVAAGVAHRSYGLNVARLANVPRAVVQLAKTKSAEMETQMRAVKHFNA